MPKFRLLKGTFALQANTEPGKRGAVTYLKTGAEIEDPRDLDLMFKNKFQRLDPSVESKVTAATKAQEDADAKKAEAATAQTDADEKIAADAAAAKDKAEGRPAPARTSAQVKADHKAEHLYNK